MTDPEQDWCAVCHKWMAYSNQTGAWVHYDTGLATCWKAEA